MFRFRPSHRAAFTLIEILVVVGIIVILVGILIPVLGRARDQANKTATVAQMGSIRMGLQQYYTDFNMYPTSSVSTNRGSAALAFALMGPNNGLGLGFQMRQTAMGGGKMYGPYLSPDPRYYIGTAAAFGATPLDHTFVDAWGNEILYFRSTRATAGDVVAAGSITTVFGTGSNLAEPPYLFNSADCLKVLNANPTLSATPLTLPAPNTSIPFLNLLGAKTNAFTGSALGSDSFLLISAGMDASAKTTGHYYTADDIIVTKQ